MSTNLFAPELQKPKVFSVPSTIRYHQKIKRANPNLEIIDAVEVSKIMINIFHKMMCYIVLKYLKDVLLIQEIHEEGHAFKIKFRNNCLGRENGVYGISLSVNAYDNDNIMERQRTMDYVITCCLNDKDSKIHYDEYLGFNCIRKFNEIDLKETIKVILQEIDKISNYSNQCNKVKEINELVEECFSSPYSN